MFPIKKTPSHVLKKYTINNFRNSPAHSPAHKLVPQVSNYSYDIHNLFNLFIYYTFYGVNYIYILDC